MHSLYLLPRICVISRGVSSLGSVLQEREHVLRMLITWHKSWATKSDLLPNVHTWYMYMLSLCSGMVLSSMGKIKFYQINRSAVLLSMHATAHLQR